MAVKSLAQSSLSKPQRHRSMLAGYETNMFHHLETIRLGSSAASVTFTNLGQYSDFQHLQIRFAAKTDRGFVNSGLFMRFNGDTGNNYGLHNLLGNGSSVTSSASLSRSTTLALPIPGGTYDADAFGGGVIDILDPFSTSKYTTVRGLGGYAIRELQLASGLWLNTASLTSITLVCILSDSYVAGTRFSLYGLKARA